MNYELFYLVGASREADLEKIKKSASEIVISEGGAFEEKQTEEKRKMAYKIGRETHGIYSAQRFDLEDPEKINSISKKLNLNPDILRFIISRTAELPELMSKEERKEKFSALEKKERQTEAKKTEPKAKEEPKAELREEKQDQPIATEEDINKKLEEILNI